MSETQSEISSGSPPPSRDVSVPASGSRRAPRTGGALLMLLIVGGWLLALAGWMVWNLRGQVKEMRTFTDPAPQAIGPVVPTGEQRAELQGRLEAFAASVGAKQPAKLELSVADLNHLLAAQEPFSRLQDIARVEEITDVIRMKVSLALNGMPFSGERLYLNGFISARPEVRRDKDAKKSVGVMLITRAVEVPGRQLSAGFTQRYLEANHLDSLVLEEARKNEKLNALFKAVTAVRCEPGKVVVEYTP